MLSKGGNEHMRTLNNTELGGWGGGGGGGPGPGVPQKADRRIFSTLRAKVFCFFSSLDNLASSAE